MKKKSERQRKYIIVQKIKVKSFMIPTNEGMLCTRETAGIN